MTDCNVENNGTNKNCNLVENSSNSLSPVPESPFCQDGQITYRNQTTVDNDSKTNKKVSKDAECVKSDPLKKYIQMVR